MQHPVCQTGQAPQGEWLIQIAHQGPHAHGTQFVHTLRVGGQGQHLQARRQAARHALANIAASDDQDPLATKARRQGTERGLV